MASLDDVQNVQKGKTQCSRMNAMDAMNMDKRNARLATQPKISNKVIANAN